MTQGRHAHRLRAPWEKKLERIAASALALLSQKRISGAPKGGGAVEVAFLASQRMRALERRYLKKAATPEVLAFPVAPGFPNPRGGTRALGEVYLNASLLRGAPERIIALFLHGLVHLLGYRHRAARDALRMERVERLLMRELARAPKKTGNFPGKSVTIRKYARALPHRS